MTADRYTWLYAVAPGGADPAVLHGLSGVAGEHPRLLLAEDLAAAVGSVPSADFAAPALHRHLEDTAWLERAVRAHHHVIDTLARAHRTLPLRFATLYRDDRRVLDLLGAHHREFHAILERIADRTEWGIKAYLDATTLRDRPDPGTGEHTDGPESGGSAENGDTQGNPVDDRPGTAYLLRRRAARDRSARSLAEASAHARQLHDVLTAFAAEAAEHPPQAPEATGIREAMLLNGAYLVDRSRTDEFARVVDDLRHAHARVLRVELTGPWPPYSFVDLPQAAGGE
ncbi:GvpL/GvpF family gas vesicle protein [Streptomyces sp. NRRL S-350]|uniref:GvpL/GvpF family gas vesicle protein n=1 Tax=Streptomyces sp. NRRL S-350 TaxID=1463902 RepID=UPI0004C0FC1B|nr:GvpL/GvpF family gas vesicle protein [Streptomyces sp. NRRL S-350]